MSAKINLELFEVKPSVEQLQVMTSLSLVINVRAYLPLHSIKHYNIAIFYQDCANLLQPQTISEQWFIGHCAKSMTIFLLGHSQ